jgi:hypothetical protein
VLTAHLTVPPGGRRDSPLSPRDLAAHSALWLAAPGEGVQAARLARRSPFSIAPKRFAADTGVRYQANPLI